MKKILSISILLLFTLFAAAQSPAWEDDIDHSDWHVLVPLGILDSIQPINKFGSNYDVDAGTPEDIWSVGGDYPVRTAEAAIQVASTDADDHVDSTGCQKIIIMGYREDWSSIYDTVTMNGITTVEGDTMFYVNRAYCYEAGSQRINDGDITITHKVDATAMSQIPEGYGQTQQAILVVPDDSDVLLTEAYVSANSPNVGNNTDPSANFGLYYLDLSRSNSSWRDIIPQSAVYYGSSNASIVLTPYEYIPGPAIIKMRVTASIENDQEFGAKFDGYLIKKGAITKNLARKRQLIFGF